MAESTHDAIPAQARAFAIEHHGDQRYGDGPYVTHLDEVAALIQAQLGGEAGDAALLRTVAYLHDVVEDTPVTATQVAERFGAVVAGAVELLSDPPGANRKQRKAALHARFERTSPEDAAGRAALIVKAADRLANVRACVANGDARLAMYADEHPAFRGAVHRPGLCDAVWSELDALVTN